MDGNGRWATKRGMPRKFGHREGAKISKTCPCIVGILVCEMHLLCFLNRKLETSTR
ncbi:MAG: undecaprenyl diphosphate synthase family protein [Ruminococcus callidus]